MVDDPKIVSQRLKRLLEHHSHLSIEFRGESFLTLLEQRNRNLAGNFAGGDMAYVANAAAGFQCVAAGIVAQTASINIECLARGVGELLAADAKIIHAGRKLIRTRCDVFVRNGGDETLVAIAQVSMSRVSDQQAAHERVIGPLTESDTRP